MRQANLAPKDPIVQILRVEGNRRAIDGGLAWQQRLVQAISGAPSTDDVEDAAVDAQMKIFSANAWYLEDSNGHRYQRVVVEVHPALHPVMSEQVGQEHGKVLRT